MKKQKVSEFIRGKSFYLVLLTGLCAVIAIALVYTNLVPGKSDQGLIDLNEPIPEIASNKINAVEDAGNNHVVEYSDADNIAIEKEDLTKKADLVVSDTTEDEALQTSASTVISSATDVTDEMIDTKTVPVIQSKPNKTESLNFKEEDGLVWPLQGNVIMNYSMDHSMYFQTLGQYKVNPALLIEAEVGKEVVSAAKGVVSEITTNEETGLTITTSIGNGYHLVYGQIDSAKVKVGDKVSQGEIIGCIAEPTKYYVVEGSNLYFQVIKGDGTINPMLLLK